jgi:uncharacterized protein
MMLQTGRVLVAYSGGVDSTYLAFVAHDVLGHDALCVLGVSPSVSQEQRNLASLTAESFRFNFREITTEEIDDPNYASNPTNRCYFCKSELYEKLAEIARVEKFSGVVDGTNADDLGDHRPGRAAAGENNVLSPLAEVGLSKAEIRELSRSHGLPTWDAPASPCLASRIAYGIPVTIGRLAKIEEGEAVLREAGFREFRLRVHDDIARIEIASREMHRILDRGMFDRVTEDIKKLGFKFVTLDMEGFRSGALNEQIDNKDE